MDMLISERLDCEVSIFCITYNQVEYLADALESFLKQKTDFKFEILINDDASTDGTTELALKYREKYPDIVRVVTHSENQFSKGINNNSEYLYPIARGKYFAFCEGDDYWTDSNKLQSQYDYLKNNPKFGFCVHASINIDAETKCILSTKHLYNQSCRVRPEDVISKVQSFATASFFVERGLYERYLSSDIFKMPAHGDQKMTLFFCTMSNAYYIDSEMSAYRMFSNGSINKTLAKDRNRLERDKEICEARIDLLAAINRLTWGEYSDAVQIGQDEAQYVYLMQCGCYNELVSPKWVDRFKKENRLTRARIKLQSMFPNVMRLVISTYRSIKY